MALTTTDISNALTRAKCCLADMQYKLGLKRAQGSKEADCLEKKVMLLSMYIEALDNVADCAGIEPTNPTGNSCNLNALSGGYCWDSGSSTLYVLIAAGFATAAPYESYYYEYSIGTTSTGPWSTLDSNNSNYAILPIEVLGDYLRIRIYCNEGDPTYREEIIEFKLYPPQFDAVTFGYFTTTSDTSLSVIPALWTVKDAETITISNQNADFIISNIEINNVSYATNVQSVSMVSGVDLNDGDVVEIFFQYIGESLPPPCDLYRLINVTVVPDPIIVAENAVMCPGSTQELSVSNYPYATYLWSTGEVTDTITISDPGVYSVVVSYGSLTGLIDYQAIVDDGINPQFGVVSTLDTATEIDSVQYACPAGLLNSVQINEFTGVVLTGATITAYHGNDDSQLGLVDAAVTTIFDLNDLGTDLFYIGITLTNGCTYYTQTYSIYTFTSAMNVLQNNCSCFGVSDGAVIASPSILSIGAVGLVSVDYELYDSLSNLVASSSGFAFSATGLDPDIYSFQYTEHWANGSVCPSGFFFITITQPVLITLTGVVTNGLCAVADGGDGLTSVQYNMTGGVGLFDLYFDGVQVITDVASGYVYTAAMTNGSHTIMVMDSNGCTASNTVTVTNPTAISSTLTTSGIGGARLTALSGGSGTYPTMELYASDLATLVGTFTLPFPSTILTANGTYWLLVIDSNGCAHIKEITVT